MQIKVLVVRDLAPRAGKAKRRWLRSGSAGLLLAASIAVMTGALAFASIPGSNGVFHGCVRTSTGALRLIDTDEGQTCKASETAVSWNRARASTGKELGPRLTSYKQGDAVSYQGSSYLAVVANTNVLPTSVSDWAVLAEAGTPGRNGTNGATILSGVGPPSDKIGATGDFYIAERGSLRYAIYGPALRSCEKLPCITSWGQGSSIVGATGPAGPNGALTADQTTSGRVDLENGDSTIITEQTVRETGDFEVSAVVAVDNQSGTSGWVCDLYADNPGDPTGTHSIDLDEEGATAPQPGTSSDATIVLTAVVSIEQGGKIWVGCSEYAERHGDSATARIISTQLSGFTTETQTGVQ